MELIKNNLNIDFVAKKNIAVSASLIVNILSIFALIFIGFNYGIDFRGGIEVQIGFPQSMSIEAVRARVSNIPLKNIEVVNFENSNDFVIMAEGGEHEAEIEKHRNILVTDLKTQFAGEKVDVKRVDVVGPKAGSQLKLSALKSVFYSMLFLLIYLAFRFDFKFAAGAILATAHDVLMILLAYVAFQKEFSLSSIAAILTVIGFSLNDTVIVFDRIRENIEKMGTAALSQVINVSINQTLSRTILTSFTVFIATICLFVFGGGVIRDFAFAMLIGIFVGTYSSIFIASPVLLYLEKYEEKFKASPALKTKAKAST